MQTIAAEHVSVSDIATECGERVTRVRNIINNLGVREERRVGTVRLFNREAVLPLVRERLARLSTRSPEVAQ